MAARKRIALVTGRISPAYGAARVVLDIAAGFLHNYDVTIITHDGDRRVQALSIPLGVHHIHISRPPHTLGWIQFVWRLRKFMRSSPDIRGYIGFLTFTNYAVLLSCLISGSTARTVVTEHSIQSRALPNMGRKGTIALVIMHFMYRLASSIICVSNAVKDDLVRNCRVDPIKCHVVYNPIDAQRINRLALEPLPNQLLELASARNVACIAELKPVKQQKLLISAMAEVPDGTSLILIGDGQDRGDLTRFALEQGLRDRVHFVGRLENPWPLVSKLGAVILASAYEGFGLVLAESAVVGTRPIGTASGGIAEVIQVLGGMSVDPGEKATSSLAAAISEAVNLAGTYVTPTLWLSTRQPKEVAEEYARTIFSD